MGKNSEGEDFEIPIKEIAVNVTDLNNQLTCTVGLDGENLNVFLMKDNIENEQAKIDIYMFAGTTSYTAPTAKVEIPNLLKYENFDGKGGLASNTRYTIVAILNDDNQSFQEADAKIIAENTQTCSKTATANSCVICYE